MTAHVPCRTGAECGRIAQCQNCECCRDCCECVHCVHCGEEHPADSCPDYEEQEDSEP